MRRVRATVTVPGPAEEAEALWLDRARWAAWIDGFAAVERLDPDWPAPGSRLRWRSVPNGRGLVEERVLSRTPARALELAVEDERLQGTQTVAFEPAGEDVWVTLELAYELKLPAFPLADRLVVRRRLEGALRRTLTRLGHERRAELDAVP